MAGSRRRRGSEILLLTVQIFSAASAIGGGVGLVFADGLGLPRTLLAGSPFSDFVVPGVILAVVVGGTQLTAAILQLRRNRWFPAASVVAALGMVIWIHVEVALLPGYSILHAFYLGSGILQLVLLFGILGGWPVTAPSRLLRGERRSAAASRTSHPAARPGSG
ncbi:hypothetical protein HQQ81_08665 [Microbacteriaceae bacterium VKM Ac-2854]|nr:hypothetical protein [Microbacteriaceae bacterium VKM Ac-2854]